MIQELLNVKWKTEFCTQGESCWCRVIVPVEPVLVDGEEAWVISSGELAAEMAEYIVDLHNKRLYEKEYFKPNEALQKAKEEYYNGRKRADEEYLQEQLKKYENIPVITNIQEKKHSMGVDVPQEVWDRMCKMEEDRKNDPNYVPDNEPCCDDTIPCSCNTFSPRMAGPKDMENFKATTQEEYESAWQKIWNKIGIPKKYLGSK